MNETVPAIRNQRRLLWPWVVAAVVLCLFATGFSFWWPMYEANQLAEQSSPKPGLMSS